MKNDNLTIIISSTFGIYIPKIHGVDTWGTLNQESMEYKDNTWYITSWKTNEYGIDTYNIVPIDIKKELHSYTEAKFYLINNGRKDKIHDLKILMKQLKDFEKGIKCNKKKKNSLKVKR